MPLVLLPFPVTLRNVAVGRYLAHSMSSLDLTESSSKLTESTTLPKLRNSIQLATVATMGKQNLSLGQGFQPVHRVGPPAGITGTAFHPRLPGGFRRKVPRSRQGQTHKIKTVILFSASLMRPGWPLPVSNGHRAVAEALRFSGPWQRFWKHQ